MFRSATDVLRRYWHRSRGRRRILLEAFIDLVRARAELRLLPFKRIAPHLGELMRETGGDAGSEAAETARGVRAAIRMVADHLPWESTCLVRALAAHRMLRRRRMPCTLYLGLNREGGVLQAHAWLRCAGRYVTGHEAAPDFARVSWFGWTPEPEGRRRIHSGRSA